MLFQVKRVINIIDQQRAACPKPRRKGVIFTSSVISVSIHLRDILVICCSYVICFSSMLKGCYTVAFIASSCIPNIVNHKNNVINFLFLYISDLFYFVINKKVKILSHELNSLHHSLKKAT